MEVYIPFYRVSNMKDDRFDGLGSHGVVGRGAVKKLQRRMYGSIVLISHK